MPLSLLILSTQLANLVDVRIYYQMFFFHRRVRPDLSSPDTHRRFGTVLTQPDSINPSFTFYSKHRFSPNTIRDEVCMIWRLGSDNHMKTPLPGGDCEPDSIYANSHSLSQKKNLPFSVGGLVCRCNTQRIWYADLPRDVRGKQGSSTDCIVPNPGTLSTASPPYASILALWGGGWQFPMTTVIRLPPTSQSSIDRTRDNVGLITQ